MSAVVDAVRQKVPRECHVKRCQREGCKVDLPAELRPFVLIDIDHSKSPAASGGKRCDFLFVNESWLAPLELKKGRAIAGEIVPQLQAGAKMAEGVLPGGARIGFRPIAAYGGALRKQERDNFRKPGNKIEFRGDREFVRLIRCGASLAQVFGAL